MTEPAAATGNPDTATEPDGDGGGANLSERIDDLTRVIARQAATLERLADDARARDRRERAGADVPLVVELFAVFGDALSLAATAGSETERTAFETFANRVERLLVGRGGQVVRPTPDVAFDALTMEAADTRATADPAADRTVAEVLQPGLTIADRSVRPAKVIVRRYRDPES
ncbi:nucleotide exchange factor GrpE [Nocardia sp. NBC_01503]|uniref:nucleotide exchange factor GrpE n=1 Tax=Nocardia sp. NBC_01503 TaxID=2975997 RepID=UPI002E7C548D|nr:nucleotide exchange factor GrpE [Nocardia sp. NBC_01503]WTL29727.1 nucleotide exchange factor GrpE [Nocardia sp. NBC_01503]